MKISILKKRSYVEEPHRPIRLHRVQVKVFPSPVLDYLN